MTLSSRCRRSAAGGESGDASPEVPGIRFKLVVDALERVVGIGMNRARGQTHDSLRGFGELDVIHTTAYCDLLNDTGEPRA